MSWRPACAILTALALPAAAALPTLPLPGREAAIVVAPGNQTEPALSNHFANFVAFTDTFTDATRPHPEVWYCRLQVRLDGIRCTAAPVPRSAGRQGAPAVSGDILVYVDEGLFGPGKGNVFRFSITQGRAGPVAPNPAFQGRPAVSERVIAWEDGRDAQSGPDIWVHDNLLGGSWSITGVGVQEMPRASGDRVSYLDLDDPRGGVKVYDIVSGKTTKAYPGLALAADIDGDFVVVRTPADVARPSADDLEVWSFDGTFQASLVLKGSQTNPHISGDWVAFEDFSTFTSRVIVWKWRPQPGDPPGPLLFAPPAGTSTQILNDISWPRVVYADDRNQATGLDIFLFDGSATGAPGGKCDRDRDEDEDEGEDERHGEHRDHDGKHRDEGDGAHRHPECPSPPLLVRCDDAGALVLADLTVERERRGPEAKNLEFQAEATMPVLACLDADRVSSAWVLLNGRALFRPDDFDPHLTHLERRRTAEAGPNRLGAIIAGKPGSRLRVRLLAERSSHAGSTAGTTAGQGPEPPGAQGCSAGGSEWSPALCLLVLLLYRPRRQ